MVSAYNGPLADAPTSPGSVLIVDDTPLNVRVMGALMRQHGFEVLVSGSGRDAVEVARRQRPDVVLLDIMMPDLDGFEVTRLLKSDPSTVAISVVFLTARTDRDSIARAFRAGGVDYVTKPFETTELVARVRTHLELKRAREHLVRKNLQLEAYSSQLRELNEEKNTLMGMAAHDLRSPINSVLIAAELMLAMPKMPEEKRASYLQTVQRTAKRMSGLISSLLDAHAIEAGQRALSISEVDLRAAVLSTVEANLPKASNKEIVLDVDLPEEVPAVWGDAQALAQVFDNLVSNAVKFSPAQKYITVRVTQPRPGVVRCSVKDQGPGLTEDDKRKLFGKFARLSAKPTAGEESTGLGLSIVKRLVNQMGGQIWCESEPGKGAEFIVELRPSSQPKPEILGH